MTWFLLVVVYFLNGDPTGVSMLLKYDSEWNCNQTRDFFLSDEGKNTFGDDKTFVVYPCEPEWGADDVTHPWVPTDERPLFDVDKEMTDG